MPAYLPCSTSASIFWPFACCVIVCSNAPETTSTIISKSIAKDGGRSDYRGLVHVAEGAKGAKSFVRCDALLLDDHSISGTKPYINMTVELSPLVYIQRPDYWGIEVVGSLPGIGLPATAPYTAAIPLDGITGKRGIEVIGATKREKVAVPPKKKK